MADPYAQYVMVSIPVDTPSGVANLFKGSFAERSAFRRFPSNLAGDFRIETASPLAGAASMAGNLGGSSGYIAFPHTSNLLVGSADFCAECYFKMTGGASSFRSVLGKYYAADNTRSWVIYALHSTLGNRCVANVSQDGYNVTQLDSGMVLTAGQKYHLALSRQGTTFRLFIDGVMKASAQVTGSLFSETNPLTLFGSNGNENVSAGYMDMVRLTIGHARYVADFTPPTSKADFYYEVQPTLFYRVRSSFHDILRFVGRNTRGTPRPIHELAMRIPTTNHVRRKFKTRLSTVPWAAGRENIGINGTVAIKGTPLNTPVARPVYLYSMTSKLPVDVTMSKADGTYQFRYLNPSEKYYAVAFDPTGFYRPVIADNLPTQDFTV